MAKTQKTAQPVTKTQAWGRKWLGVALWEWAGLALLVAVGAWLRLFRLDLIEFKGDEAIAAWLALQFVKGGSLPLAGLMSSVGVTNPPLFIYLLVPMFLVSGDPSVIGALLVVQSLAAVVICWHIGRRYYGSLTGLVSAAMFAVSPWAVIYSRKIWAIDLEPLLTCGVVWALHALVLGRRPKAIFWVALLVPCLMMNHFSGFGPLAAVLGVLLLLRPRLDWRWTAGGLLIAGVLALPYVRYQQINHWADLSQARATVGTDRWSQLPPGMTVHPQYGARLPRRPSEMWQHVLAVYNSGEVEDVLGLSADRRFDPAQLHAQRPGGPWAYFTDSLRLGDTVLQVQQWVFVGAFMWLAVLGVKGLRRQRGFPWVGVVEDNRERTVWILLFWVIGLVAVFFVARLWTYLLYFVVLYPVHFLATGALFQMVHGKWATKGARVALYAALGVVLVWNVMYMLDFYRFVDRNGGAFGTYGSVLGPKREVAKFLAEQGGPKLVEDARAQLDMTVAPSLGRRPQAPDGLQHPLVVQMDNFGRFELPQVDLPYLILLEKERARTTRLPTNMMVVVVDDNRAGFSPQQWQQIVAMRQTNFGPIRLLFVPR